MSCPRLRLWAAWVNSARRSLPCRRWPRAPPPPGPAPGRARWRRAIGRTGARGGRAGGASLPPLRQVLRPHQDLPRLGSVAGTDDPVLLHHVDEARGLGIAEAEPPLEEGDGGGALGDDEVHGVPVHVVAVLALAAREGPLLVQLHLLVHRRALSSQKLADRLDLVVGDPGAVHAHLARAAGRHEDHVAAPQELLGAVAVEDGA